MAESPPASFPLVGDPCEVNPNSFPSPQIINRPPKALKGTYQISEVLRLTFHNLSLLWEWGEFRFVDGVVRKGPDHFPLPPLLPCSRSLGSLNKHWTWNYHLSLSLFSGSHELTLTGPLSFFVLPLRDIMSCPYLVQHALVFQEDLLPKPGRFSCILDLDYTCSLFFLSLLLHFFDH